MENECNWYDITCALSWLQAEIKAFFVWVLGGIFDGVATVLETVPAPSFLGNVDPIVIPAGVAWAVQSFEIPLGITILVSAYIIRFTIRRIPIIG